MTGLLTDTQSADSNHATQSQNERLEWTLVGLLYENLPTALIVTIINAVIVTVTLTPATGLHATGLWLSAILALSIWRYSTIAGFKRALPHDEAARKWRHRFALGALPAAALWGYCASALYPTGQPQLQTLIAIVTAGMAAGASSSMAAYPKVFRVYLGLMLAPFIVRLLVGGSLPELATAAMAALFAAGLVISTDKSSRLLRDALRLRIKNADLIDELKQAVSAVEAENRERQKSEIALRQATRDAEEATLAKTRFLANMSHEIRTPMNGVFGMTDLLMRTTLDARQKKLVGTIHESAKSLLTIINDILDLSRIESGKLELDSHEFNLRDTVERAVELFATQIKDKSLEVTLFIDRDVPACVMGDSGRLKQVILNLVGNALKFTKFGEISVRVSVLDRAEQSSRVLIEIADTGIGIDARMKEKLFQPFTQAETSISRRFGGTGLGLSISRHLVEMMGGTITLDSELGRGTRVTIDVPMAHGAAGADVIESDYEALDGARILVVDDRETNQEIICNYLHDAGAATDRASTTKRAWALLDDATARALPYHAMIVDMLMPDENGIEFSKRVKADQRFAKIRLILATSLEWQADAAEVRAAGIETLLTKPIRRQDLVDAAARVVSGTRHPGWRLEREQRRAGAAATTHAELPKLGGHVLLAEDNPVNIEVAQEFLKDLGCTVTLAGDGLEAVKALKHGSFDLVLMDCQMPILDGLAATRRVRDMEQATGRARTAIIAVTANAFAEDRARCLDAGMDDYLSKPYTETQLTEILRKWLPSDAARAEAAAAAPAPTAKAATAIAIADQPAKAAPAAALPAPVAGHFPAAADVLDDAVLDPLRKARPDLLAKLTSTYLNYAPQAVAALTAALREGNLEIVRTQAHSLKSSSANLGAHVLADLMKTLERAARDGDADAVARLAPHVEPNFAATEAALRRQCPALESAAPKAQASAKSA